MSEKKILVLGDGRVTKPAWITSCEMTRTASRLVRTSSPLSFIRLILRYHGPYSSILIVYSLPYPFFAEKVVDGRRCAAPIALDVTSPDPGSHVAVQDFVISLGPFVYHADIV